MQDRIASCKAGQPEYRKMTGIAVNSTIFRVAMQLKY
jgi:hypothetical protein